MNGRHSRQPTHDGVADGSPKTVIFDAVAVAHGSAAVVGEHLVRAWAETFPDSVRVLVSSGHDEPFPVPAGVKIVSVRSFPGPVGGLWGRSGAITRACLDLGADVLISLVTASALAGAPCRRAVIVHDLRHEILPGQFSLGRRMLRRVSYGISFRRADVLLCNSRRTRGDVLRHRPSLSTKAVVVPFGGDHVERWPVPTTSSKYAIAFGSFANKNVEAVIRAWAHIAAQAGTPSLRVVGIAESARPRLNQLVSALGMQESVSLEPWLDDARFCAAFAAASVIVFPSAFEGFGLPALEALWLKIPLVISADPALVELCGDHAVTLPSVEPDAIAAGVLLALKRTDAELEEGARRVRDRSWRRTAEAIRDAVLV